MIKYGTNDKFQNRLYNYVNDELTNFRNLNEALNRSNVNQVLV